MYIFLAKTNNNNASIFLIFSSVTLSYSLTLSVAALFQAAASNHLLLLPFYFFFHLSHL